MRYQLGLENLTLRCCKWSKIQSHDVKVTQVEGGSLGLFTLIWERIGSTSSSSNTIDQDSITSITSWKHNQYAYVSTYVNNPQA